MSKLVTGVLRCWSYRWPTVLHSGKRRLLVDAPSNDNNFSDRSRYRALRRWHRSLQEERRVS